jgi:hypothetical protein
MPGFSNVGSVGFSENRMLVFRIGSVGFSGIRMFGFQDWIGWFFRDSDVWFSGLDRLVFRIQDIGVFFSVADTKIYKSQVERKLFRLMAAFAR